MTKDERTLFTQRCIDVLISKNSGSSVTEPKLEVTRERRTPVLIFERLRRPEAGQTFFSGDEVLEALKQESYLSMRTHAALHMVQSMVN